MSVMFIGRYNGQYMNFDGLKTLASPPRVAANDPKCFPTAADARDDAATLFPFISPTVANPNGPYEFVRSFLQPEFNQTLQAMIAGNPNLERAKRGYGWVAVVRDEDFQNMINVLGYPNGPLCQMYDIEIIPLNNDPNTAEVYFHMTPAMWGAGPTLALVPPNTCYSPDIAS